MSEFFECYFLWLLLGLFLGFILFWLYDLLFRRNDDNDSDSDSQAPTPSANQFVNTAAATQTPVQTPVQTPTIDLNEHIVMSDSSKVLAKELGLKPQKSNKDDLTVVEGIGPKISQLLIADGIETFHRLEKTEVSHIQKILDDAGPSFKLAKPESWPRQSGLCVIQDWKELKEYQDRLFNGVEFDN